MALTARNKFAAIDILQTDFEYVTVSRWIEGSRDVLGAPARTLTQQQTNLKVDLQRLVGSPGFINQTGASDTQKQGIVSQSTHLMITASETDILDNDVITDIDGTLYDVETTAEWWSHLEVFLIKRN